MRIDYVCIFCQSKDKFKFYNSEAAKLGTVAQDTPTGKVYGLKSIFPNSNLGTKLLKIRVVDSTRPQLGNVDFCTTDFMKYREHLLKDLSTKLIDRGDHEMVELSDREFDVLLYFTNPPTSQLLGIHY